MLTLRFCALFLVLIGGFAGLTSTDLARRLLHEPLSHWVAALSVPLLSLAGTASSSGNYLNFNGFAASIVEACNGVLPTYIYVAAVLAFPSRWREKLWGILIGIPAIFGINLARVVTLMLVGASWPELFELIHIYVWQTLVIALSMVIWIFWAERLVQPGLETNR